MSQRRKLFQAQKIHFCQLSGLKFMASHVVEEKASSDELIRFLDPPKIFDS